MTDKLLTFTLGYSALRKDGTFFRPTKNGLRGALEPTLKQPDVDLAQALLADFSGNPPNRMHTIKWLITKLISRGAYDQ